MTVSNLTNIYPDRLTKEEYTLLKDSFYGTGGFKDGTYCTKHGDEETSRYDVRRALATTPLFVNTVTTAYTAPIFGEIARNIKGEYVEEFLADCDGYGTPFNVWWESFANKAKLYGCNIYWFDSTTIQPDNKLEAKIKRTIPYLVDVSPLDMNQNYKMDGIGNLRFFVYFLECDDKGNDIYLAYRDGQFYKTMDCNGVPSQGQEYFDAISKPVVYNTCDYVSPFCFPPSPYLSSAKMQQNYYQNTSNLEYQALHTSLSFMTYQGVFGEDASLNVHSIINYPNGNNPPGFITVPNTMERIQDRLDKIEKTIFSANNLAVMYVDSGASGEAKKESDTIRRQILRSDSNAMSQAEKRLWESFVELTGQKPESLDITYPVDFESMTISMDLDNAIKFNALQMAPTNMAKIRAKLMTDSFPNATQEEKRQFEIDEMENDPLKDSKLFNADDKNIDDVNNGMV